MFSFLDGKKSYVGGILMMLTGVLGLFGVGTGADGSTPLTPGEAIALISAGWALISVKSAISKVE